MNEAALRKTLEELQKLVELNEPLKTTVEQLQQVVDLDVSKVSDFAKKNGVRRRPTVPTKSLPGCKLSLPKDKDLSDRTLIAHILNFHINLPNQPTLAVIEVDHNEVLTIYYHEGKKEKVKAAIVAVLNEWTPLQDWELRPFLAKKNISLLCNGYPYLPYLMAYAKRKTLNEFIKEYGVETTEDKDKKSRKVNCVMVVDPLDVKQQSKAAELLSGTFREAVSSQLLRAIYRDYCDGLESLCETPFKQDFQNLNKQILELLFGSMKGAKENAQRILEIYLHFIEQNITMLEFLEKKEYYQRLSYACKIQILGEKLNRFAAYPTIIPDVPSSMNNTVNNFNKKLHNNETALMIFKNCEAEINALFSFYCGKQYPDKIKAELSRALLDDSMVQFNLCLKSICLTPQTANSELETLLKKTDAIIKQLVTHTAEPKKNEERLLHENAISLQLNILNIFMQFYCVLEKWGTLEKISARYFEVLQTAPPATVQHRDKKFMAACTRLKHLLAQKKYDDAFEQYKFLCECFFTQLKETAKQEEVFYVGTFGENLIDAFAKTDNYLDVLIFANETLVKLVANNRDSAEVSRFKASCKQLERKHLHLLVMCEPAILSIDEKTLTLVLRPQEPGVLDVFKNALKACGINSVVKENYLVIVNPNYVSISAFKKALATVPRVKQKFEDTAVQVAKAEAEKVSAVMPASGASSSSSFWCDPTASIGLQKRIRDKKPEKKLSDEESASPPLAAVEKEFLYVDFGGGFVYDERLGTNQRIIALEGGSHGFGKYFGFIDGDVDGKFRATLENGRIVGGTNQKGLVIEKTNNGKGKIYKIKIMEEESLVGKEDKETVVDDRRRILLCFNAPKTHAAVKREFRK